MEMDSQYVRDPLQVQVEPTPRGYIVRLSGEADVEAAEQFWPLLEPLLASRPQVTIFDVSALSYICSSGLGCLVRYHTASRDFGKTMLIAPNGHVRDVLKRSRVIELFEEIDAPARA